MSTNRPITYHLNFLNRQKTTTYGVGNLGPGFGHAQKCGGVKPVNGISNPPLENRISNVKSDLVCTVI